MTLWSPWALARELRYAIPRNLGRLGLGPQPDQAAAIAQSLSKSGCHITFGYFQGDVDNAQTIAQANIAIASHLAAFSPQSYLSVKAPPMQFDRQLLYRIATAANAHNRSIVFDSHSPNDARQTLELVTELSAEFPQTGCVLPARWQRSLSDADRLAPTAARIRIVKGEWPDDDGAGSTDDANYMALVQRLAGRAAPVAIATHDSALAQKALSLLLKSGTPCEWELLRGLPRRQAIAVAQRLGVPVRIYVPFGNGWWPYAVNKALSRPYLPMWYAKDSVNAVRICTIPP